MRKLEDEIKAVKAAAVQLNYDFVMPGVCVCIESAYAEDPTGGRASALMTECRKRMDRLYDLGLYTLAPVGKDVVSCISQCYEGVRR